jgi:hypothetical protein
MEAEINVVTVRAITHAITNISGPMTNLSQMDAVEPNKVSRPHHTKAPPTMACGIAQSTFDSLDWGGSSDSSERGTSRCGE